MLPAWQLLPHADKCVWVCSLDFKNVSAWWWIWISYHVWFWLCHVKFRSIAPQCVGDDDEVKYCYNMHLGKWDGIRQCIHLCAHVWVCVGVSVCAKGRYSPASWLILLMASSKTRREAEKHGVRERAKRMQSRTVALWWQYSNLSQKRF